MTEKKSQAQTQVNDVKPLNDDQLTDVNGGDTGLDGVLNPNKKIWCTSYSYCGLYNEVTEEITYYPCSKCHTPMYTQPWNPRWICDCCDNKEFYPGSEIWTKSREQLISDAVY